MHVQDVLLRISILLILKMRHWAGLSSVTLYPETPLFAFLLNETAVSWHTLILNTVNTMYSEFKIQAYKRKKLKSLTFEDVIQVNTIHLTKDTLN